MHYISEHPDYARNMSIFLFRKQVKIYFKIHGGGICKNAVIIKTFSKP